MNESINIESLLAQAKELAWNQDEAQALKLYLQAAELGSPDGMFEAAEAFFWGRGCEENHVLARDWYQKAADADHIAAATALGIMLFYGDGVPKDIPLARHYLETGADAGDEEAEDALDALEEEEAARAKRAEQKAKRTAKKKKE